MQKFSYSQCRKDYVNEIYANSMLCANGGNKTQGVCFGDSGGPLFDMHGAVVGVVSWGSRRCAVPQYPGVFGKVSTAASWIERMICQLSQSPPASLCPKKKTRRRSNIRNLRKQSAEAEIESYCLDTSDLFDASNKIKGLDCRWLAYNNTRTTQSDPCDFPFIASKCPKTCEVCGFFDKETGLLDEMYFSLCHRAKPRVALIEWHIRY